MDRREFIKTAAVGTIATGGLIPSVEAATPKKDPDIRIPFAIPHTFEEREAIIQAYLDHEGMFNPKLSLTYTLKIITVFSKKYDRMYKDTNPDHSLEILLTREGKMVTGGTLFRHDPDKRVISRFGLYYKEMESGEPSWAFTLTLVDTWDPKNHLPAEAIGRVSNWTVQ